MKIAFEVNGVLRNTFGKAEEVYQKFFIDDYVQGEDEEDFEFKLNLPITSTTLSNHFVFPDEERLMEFFYVDFPMNIFGHSQSTENSTFHDLNDIYKDFFTLTFANSIYMCPKFSSYSAVASLIGDNIIYSFFDEKETSLYRYKSNIKY